MLYPHLLKLWIKSPDIPPGSQSTDTGAWTPNPDATDVVIYEGAADVQDNTRRTVRDDAGRPTPNADAIAFLADEFVLTGRGGTSTILATDDGADVVADDENSADPLFIVLANQERVRTGVYATITYEDSTVEHAAVVGFRRLDGCVMLRRLLVPADQ